MNKYERLLSDLGETGRGVMRCAGNSMLPILSNPSTNTYEVRETYEVGDIVLARVKGRWIDAHLITAKGGDGRYLISNNHGHDNGWTRAVHAKVVESRSESGAVKRF